jgi:hypothetical protein
LVYLSGGYPGPGVRVLVSICRGIGIMVLFDNNVGLYYGDVMKGFAERGFDKYVEYGRPAVVTPVTLALTSLLELLAGSLDFGESHVTDTVLLAWNVDDDSIVDCMSSILLNRKYKKGNLSLAILSLMLDASIEERVSALAICCGFLSHMKMGYSLS